MTTNRLLVVAVTTAVLVLGSVLVYAMWWNAHFACVQYRPF